MIITVAEDELRSWRFRSRRSLVGRPCDTEPVWSVMLALIVEVATDNGHHAWNAIKLGAEDRIANLSFWFWV